MASYLRIYLSRRTMIYQTPIYLVWISMTTTRETMASEPRKLFSTNLKLLISGTTCGHERRLRESFLRTRYQKDCLVSID
ncbi:hypothetical protein CFB44_02090 [Burkholderia sp. AU31280]|nr:hypothetical protein CFB44_02090 [Burkholderia sp. AU31280]PRG93782.1 hypothetical protein C6V04_12640 [Burkholderia multivorans]